MMLRKLVTIQKIDDVKPIPNADKIEQANVLGWTLVVEKDEFKPGDLCVFFEIDSLLPADKEWAQFMAPSKFRVKTVKKRGCLSQGLALPLTILPVSEVWTLGDEVTDALGVTKYEPPVSTQGTVAAGAFPSFVPKTDEMRLQSVMGVLDELKDKSFYVTTKCDGQSITFLKQDGELIVCGRNLSLRDGNNNFWNVARRYDLANKLPEGMCIQGELCGPGIQKNRLGLRDVDVFIFNVFDVAKQRFLDWDAAVLFCHRIGLKTVPLEFEVDDEDLKRFPFTLECFLELAKGDYVGTKNRKEGIVVRPTVECRSNALGGSRFSFKVLNNEFLLHDD